MHIELLSMHDFRTSLKGNCPSLPCALKKEKPETNFHKIMSFVASEKSKQLFERHLDPEVSYVAC